MDLRNSWRAAWEKMGLHISGTTDLFPNDFSTAHLRPESDDREAGVRTYRLGFARDKEPFCGTDLVGPVHHWDRNISHDIRVVRVLSPTDVEIARCVIEPRDAAT